MDNASIHHIQEVINLMHCSFKWWHAVVNDACIIKMFSSNSRWSVLTRNSKLTTAVSELTFQHSMQTTSEPEWELLLLPFASLLALSQSFWLSFQSIFHLFLVPIILALDGVYHPLLAAFPDNLTLSGGEFLFNTFSNFSERCALPTNCAYASGWSCTMNGAVRWGFYTSIRRVKSVTMMNKCSGWQRKAWSNNTL